jgi:hypothetical protein
MIRRIKNRKLEKRTLRRKFESVSPAAIGRSKEIVDWAINYIKGVLPDYEGESVYGADLGNLITEGPNNDGYYEDYGWPFLARHINDAKDEYDYEMDNFGEVLHNPFEDPYAFVVCMLINTVNDILGSVPIVEENWDDEFELTKQVIDKIIRAL